jgi:Catalase-related immune-responsive
VRHPEDDDYVQAGALYQVMKEDERQRLIDSLAGSLAQVSRPEVIARSVEHFRRADAEYGRCLTEAVAASTSARPGSSMIKASGSRDPWPRSSALRCPAPRSVRGRSPLQLAIAEPRSSSTPVPN